MILYLDKICKKKLYSADSSFWQKSVTVIFKIIMSPAVKEKYDIGHITPNNKVQYWS